jgi:KipI family sensor histidine kinase inhibitor
VTRVRILPAGSRARLLAPEDPIGISPLASALRRSGLAGVSDVLPAAQTVLVTTAAGVDLRALERSIQRVIAACGDADDTDLDADSQIVRIPVSYTGCDLHEVASMLGMSVDDVVGEHTRRTWRCAFVGFTPGFGYLVSGTPGLAVARRAQPRTSVPAGAVALADGYSAIYPRRSPGGWHIIGTTTVSTWDLTRPEPARIRPGRRVQFVAEPNR